MQSKTHANVTLRTCSLYVVWCDGRISATLSCPMKLQIYPLDTQRCPMMFESCKFLLFFSFTVFCECFIPRLHDQAKIEQSSSKRPANAFRIHVLDVCFNCWMFAWCLFDICLMFASNRLCFMHASYLLDVCSTFAPYLPDVCSMFAWCLLDDCLIV